MDRNPLADGQLLEALPYSLEAEQSVLGAVIAGPGTAITDVLEYLKPECFYRQLAPARCSRC